MTYLVAKVVSYFVHTAYVETTFRDVLYFELGPVIVAAVATVHAWL